MTEIESRIGQDAEGLQSPDRGAAAAHRAAARGAREGRAGRDAAGERPSSSSTPPSGDARCRMSPSGCAQRERDLQEIVEREGNDAAQRIQIALGDIERRQVEQLQRIVSRETTRYSEAASQQFDVDDAHLTRGGRAPPRAASSTWPSTGSRARRRAF